MDPIAHSVRLLILFVVSFTDIFGDLVTAKDQKGGLGFHNRVIVDGMLRLHESYTYLFVIVDFGRTFESNSGGQGIRSRRSSRV